MTQSVSRLALLAAVALTVTAFAQAQEKKSSAPTSLPPSKRLSLLRVKAPP